MRSVSLRVALFAVITGLLSLVLALTVANFQVRPTNTYSAMFTDVSGMKVGQDVRAAGVNIGRIQHLGLRGNQAVVTFTVDSAIPLTTTTHATVRWKNVIGDRFIDLSQAPGPAAPLPEGATIPASNTTGALDLDQLSNGFRPLFRGLDPQQTNKLSSEIIQVMQGQGDQLTALFDNLGQFTNGVADHDAQIGGVIENMNTVLGGLDQRSNNLSDLLVQSSRLASGLNHDKTNIIDSTARIQHMSDQLAALLHDIRPDFADDVTQIRRLADVINQNQSQLNIILADLPTQDNTMAGFANNGSYIGIYLCGLTTITDNPNGGISHSPLLKSSAPRCQPK